MRISPTWKLFVYCSDANALLVFISKCPFLAATVIFDAAFLVRLCFFVAGSCGATRTAHTVVSCQNNANAEEFRPVKDVLAPTAAIYDLLITQNQLRNAFTVPRMFRYIPNLECVNVKMPNC